MKHPQSHDLLYLVHLGLFCLWKYDPLNISFLLILRPTQGNILVVFWGGFFRCFNGSYESPTSLLYVIVLAQRSKVFQARCSQVLLSLQISSLLLHLHNFTLYLLLFLTCVYISTVQVSNHFSRMIPA